MRATRGLLIHRIAQAKRDGLDVMEAENVGEIICLFYILDTYHNMLFVTNYYSNNICIVLPFLNSAQSYLCERKMNPQHYRHLRAPSVKMLNLYLPG
jgi:hypothetical protein